MSAPAATLVRADAGPRIGSGHVMRCLALAQYLLDRGAAVTFLMHAPPAPVRAALEEEGITVAELDPEPGSAGDARDTRALADELDTGWIVLDGYAFGGDYQAGVRESGRRLLVLDDYGHADRYVADLLLNQNLAQPEGGYRERAPGVPVLAGPGYALLRREFRRAGAEEREHPEVATRLLVTLGGSDPVNGTERVLAALAELADPALEVRVLVGPANPHADSLEKWPARLPGTTTLETAGPGEMLGLMRWAHLAVAAGGSTSWEMACTGLPAILLLVAENQRPVVEPLDRLGAARFLGEPDTLDPGELAAAIRSLLDDQATRAALATRAREVVDGQGAARVAMKMRQAGYSLRPARQEDRDLLHVWANDPETRIASFSVDPIPHEDHVRWFEGVLADPDRRLLVAEDPEGVPIAQIRFDLDGDEAEISASLAPERRGAGIGSMLIDLGVAELFATTRVRRVLARIKAENDRSVRAFERAGFRRDRREPYRDQDTWYCYRSREHLDGGEHG